MTENAIILCITQKERKKRKRQLKASCVECQESDQQMKDVFTPEKPGFPPIPGFPAQGPAPKPSQRLFCVECSQTNSTKPPFFPSELSSLEASYSEAGRRIPSAQPYLHLHRPHVLHRGWLARVTHHKKLLSEGGRTDVIEGKDFNCKLSLPGRVESREMARPKLLYIPFS